MHGFHAANTAQQNSGGGALAPVTPIASAWRAQPRKPLARPAAVEPPAIRPTAIARPTAFARPAVVRPLARPQAAPAVAVTGVTTTETSFEVGVGPFRFSGVKRYAQDSLKITYPNGVTVEATGALAAELWRNRAAFSSLGNDDPA
ncbi:hypothetical protein ACRYCC_22145 [Actinomadura scrupuli]|uniref:hypothetical protein n=1 Tax=Actinomadura scrupuli TaxID=559629 RepID=UPI003D967EF8